VDSDIFSYFLDAEELANLPDEITPTLQSAMIDCSPENNNVEP